MVSFVAAARFNSISIDSHSYLRGSTAANMSAGKGRLLDNRSAFGNRNNTYTYDCCNSFNLAPEFQGVRPLCPFTPAALAIASSVACPVDRALASQPTRQFVKTT